MRFYQVIIGSEILNRRRKDKHFDFLSEALLKLGQKLYASFVIEDDATLITRVFELVKSDPQSVLFSFGGIGSTPDDLTREIAAKVFTGRPLQTHEEARRRIIAQFGEEAFPHRIRMAELPQNAGLLDNPVNNVPGFSIDNRYFFTPGFPQMAHPMVEAVLEKLLPDAKPKPRITFTALTSENELIAMMQKVPQSVEFSSLPAFCGDKRIAVISLASDDEAEVARWYKAFQAYMQAHNIAWVEGDRHHDPDLCRSDD